MILQPGDASVLSVGLIVTVAACVAAAAAALTWLGRFIFFTRNEGTAVTKALESVALANQDTSRRLERFEERLNSSLLRLERALGRFERGPE